MDTEAEPAMMERLESGFDVAEPVSHSDLHDPMLRNSPGSVQDEIAWKQVPNCFDSVGWAPSKAKIIECPDPWPNANPIMSIVFAI